MTDPYIPKADPNEIRIPTTDLVWAMRNSLKRQYQQAQGREPIIALDPDVQQTLGNEVYPYTKGPDYANDLLGYGERLREVHRFLDAYHKLCSKTLISRRTRSGRAPENAEESPTNSLDSVRPSQPPSSGESSTAPTMHKLRHSNELAQMASDPPPSSGEDSSPPSSS